MHKYKVRVTSVCLLMISTLLGCQTTEPQTSTSAPTSVGGEFSSSQANKGISVQNKAQALERADEAKSNNDYERALYYYIQALEFDKADADVYFQIGEIHRRLKNTDVASRAYQNVLKYEPEHSGALQALGGISMAERDYQTAKQHLQQAITIDQQRLRKHTVENKSSSGQVALQSVYLSLDDNSPVNAYVVAGVIEDIQENHALARRYYQLALQHRPKSAPYLTNIGYSFYLTGNYEHAEGYYKRAINYKRQFARAWSNLGLVYARQGHYERSIKTLKQIMPEHDAFNDLGYFLLLEDNLDLAERYFTQAINTSPIYFEKANLNLEQVQLLKRERLLKAQALPVNGSSVREVNKGSTEEILNHNYKE
ncbi:tetratricopeptide repeat protein [Thalassotalea litorea]|nr:tetratricopeptide repeat protein [Thalassotalea litorea]